MHAKHDCIHEHLPQLASQRTPQRYVAAEKAATAAGSGTAQALRIHVSAQSLSSDPGRACFAAGESYSAFEGGSEYTCTSADVITAAKRAMLLEQLMPLATSAFSRLLRVQRLHGPLVLRNARCGYGGGVPVPEAHHTVGVDADFVVYLTARPIDVGGESSSRYNPSSRHNPSASPSPNLSAPHSEPSGLCVEWRVVSPGHQHVITIVITPSRRDDRLLRPLRAGSAWPAHRRTLQLVTPTPARGGGPVDDALPRAGGDARAHPRARLLRTATRTVPHRRRRAGHCPRVTTPSHSREQPSQAPSRPCAPRAAERPWPYARHTCSAPRERTLTARAFKVRVAALPPTLCIQASTRRVQAATSCVQAATLRVQAASLFACRRAA
jgi:hypothetical protein